jgi:hypothetical protein
MGQLVPLRPGEELNYDYKFSFEDEVGLYKLNAVDP